MTPGDLVVWRQPPPEPTPENPNPGEGSIGLGYVKRVVAITEEGVTTDGAWVGLLDGPVREHFVPDAQVVAIYSPSAIVDKAHLGRELAHVTENRKALGWRQRAK